MASLFPMQLKDIPLHPGRRRSCLFKEKPYEKQTINSGDELGRTQQGNNNAYCYDGELSGSTGNTLIRNCSPSAGLEEHQLAPSR